MTRLVIHNFRVGFATNSSSSHSLVLIPDSAVGQVGDIDANDDYGWGDFRCATTEAKMRYLAAQVFNTAYGEQDRARFFETFRPYVENIETIVPKEGESPYSWESDAVSIDHQSRMSSPTTFKESFVKPLMAVFMDPRLVVLGGNDNTDARTNTVPGQRKTPLSNLIRDGSGTSVRPDGDVFVLFDRYTGKKLRISATGDEGDVPSYTKASAPELVDLKITDYCGANCRFCYQGSTTDGVHAPLDRIKAILDMLAQMRVFEVAIGGGEPTDHPNFGEILKYADAVGVKPNFTTMSDRWLADETLVEIVKEVVGGIGVSCSSEKGLPLFERIKTQVGARWGSPQVSIQHVVGAVPQHVTANLLDTAFKARHHVLLLGFKPVGFGADYTRYDDENLPFTIRMAVQRRTKNEVALSVDTALIDQYPNLPAILDAPKVLVTSPEGKFSCYIDAVKQRMAASSYGDVASTDPLPDTEQDFLKTFSTY